MHIISILSMGWTASFPWPSSILSIGREMRVRERVSDRNEPLVWTETQAVAVRKRARWAMSWGERQVGFFVSVPIFLFYILQTVRLFLIVRIQRDGDLR